MSGMSGRHEQTPQEKASAPVPGRHSATSEPSSSSPSGSPTQNETRRPSTPVTPERQAPTVRPAQPSVEGRPAWTRLGRMGKPRLTRAQLLGTVLTLALGFAIVTQVQQTQDSGLESMRQEDLVQVLDDVSQRSSRLEDQVRELQAQRDALKSGAGDSQAALSQAKQRLDTLQMLAGTAQAQGPGIRLTINDPDGKVTSALLLDTVEELRDAGAEAIQVGPSRVVAQTWFGTQDGHLVAEGVPLTRPYVVLAIGAKDTMASAMNIPGGIVETLRSQGASATVDQVDTVHVDALQTPRTPRYAQPVPQRTSPSSTSSSTNTTPSPTSVGVTG